MLFAWRKRMAYAKKTEMASLKTMLADHPEKRAELRALTSIQPVWNLKMVVLLAIWVAAGWAILATDSLWVRVPAWFVIGAVIHSFAIFMHEACHGILFENRFLNRWVGWLAGLPALVPVSAYGSVHLTHHAHTKTEEDPDELMYPDMPQIQGRLGILVWLLVGGPYYIGLHVPFFSLKLARPAERVKILVEYALTAAVVGGLYLWATHAGRVELLFELWLIPGAFALALVNLRGAAEHILCRADNPLTDTRTVTSNRLVSFAMNNLNYHLEHHLVARVPWYNLPRMHAMMKELYAPHDVHLRSSYLAFLAELLWKGPLDLETWHLEGDARARQEAHRARWWDEKRARKAAARAAKRPQHTG